MSGSIVAPETVEHTTAEFRSRARKLLQERSVAPIDGLPTDEAVRTAKTFQAALFDAGLAGITWPRAYGGQGLTAAEQQAFDEEAVEYELPTYPFMVSLGMCGPILIDLGTEEQKLRYVPPLLRGDEIWCQLFSEPGAGSDVASLQTRARLDGDSWVIDGQKVWTSRAHIADYGILLARTAPEKPKHQGITMFILDMTSPGVDVRPLYVMSGKSPFNEVFLDNVRIPKDAVVGVVNEGWKAAIQMLGHERRSLGAQRPAKNNALSYQALLELSERVGLRQNPAIRQRLAEFYSHEKAMELMNARYRQESLAGRPPGVKGSVTKLEGAVQLDRALEMVAALGGPGSIAWDEPDGHAAELIRAVNAAPSIGIAGGTNEIQRNIIGERVLGLPKEPQVDRTVAFSELAVGTRKKEA